MTPAKVMLVEDDTAQREALTEFLQWSGFEVVAFASGRDAVDALTAGTMQVDAAVVDWHLPGIGGQGVVAAVRERWGNVPVIVASGSPLSTGERKNADWTVALRKPFSMRRVAQLLREHLDIEEA